MESWVSDNGIWEVYPSVTNDSIIVENVLDFTSQSVIIYSDGSVGYDRPFEIPEYVKDQVERIVKEM